jgi:hypothetical protein
MSGNVPHVNETSLTRIIQSIRDLYAGRSNAVGTVTLRANEATTVVTALNVGKDSRIFLTPKTANASAEFGAGSIYVGTVGAGTFTITHANNANVDKIFYWLALG